MEKILVIQTAFLGDAVLTLPMLQKLKEINSSSVIDVIAIPSTREIFASSPVVNEVFVLDKRGAHRSIFKLIKFAGDIKKRGYDKLYSPHRSFRTSFLVMQSGIRETFGFNNSSLPYIYKKQIQYHSNRHEIQRNLDLIGFAYNSENWKIPPLIIPSAADQKKVDDYLIEENISGEIAAIAPGSVWNTKRYPIEYFSQISDYLYEKNFNVIFIGNENDREICNIAARTSKYPVKIAAGRFSIRESIQLLNKSSLLITNDSAPAHFGMAAGVKTLTIYCSTVPEFGFYPYTKDSDFISYDDLSCKPCGIHGYDKCPISTFECGYKLIPADVISKINQLI